MAISPSVIVITPTIGKPLLKMAIDSVANQTYKNVKHLVVIDGHSYEEQAGSILNGCSKGNLIRLVLPFNTGQKNFYGHRVYAACSYLVNEDLVFFLDEDNWYELNHIETLVEVITSKKLEWAYSLRKIFDHTGKFVTVDNCESLGVWPSYSRLPNLVDTSCYAIKREILVTVAHAWYSTWGGDRNFYGVISSKFKNFMSSKLYTLNYRLHENLPPTKDFFLSGNEFMQKLYSKLPWTENS